MIYDLFFNLMGKYNALAFIDMESEPQDLVNGDTQTSPTDREEATRKSKRKRLE